MAGKRQTLSARVRLLAAADELFYQHGIASTGVDAVIERAGVATASLYKNFTGKDDLVASYLRIRDQRWRDHWEGCISEHTDPAERVLALFTALDRWDAGPGPNRGCAHLAAHVQLPADHPGNHVAMGHKFHLHHRLRELVAAAGIDDPDDLTLDLLLLYEGALNHSAFDLDPDPTGRARRLALLRLQTHT